MIERFEGVDGKRRLAELLLEQTLVGHNTSLADYLASCGELVPITAGTVLIEQGNSDTDLYFIITGSFDVIVNGKKMAFRASGTHVGEMVLADKSLKRSATLLATEESVVLRITEPQFKEAADKNPEIWKSIAKILARRLEQRNSHVAATRDKIRVFIMSSAESLEIARAVQNALEHDPFHVVIWTDGVFCASSYPLESLEEQVDLADFAIAIAQADDSTMTRRKDWPTVRDNVVFELGFFMGRIGKKRSILIERRGEEPKLPSDLAGFTTLSYKWSGEVKELPAAIAPVCNRLRAIFHDLGTNN
ncbi:TIR domain-containing protein [Armatimonas rosea]|uniref:Putative nucleotide-binding protein n=1 Tax=Armatimonas rosea TaxID=685828 RepID=A0A7W9SXU0_ARMRO|nr:TIR domain-containing protein [Armatimonas rosea]MBB6053908.1 putative nucleotide-binding protein [Armatimonas rosea]